MEAFMIIKKMTVSEWGDHKDQMGSVLRQWWRLGEEENATRVEFLGEVERVLTWVNTKCALSSSGNLVGVSLPTCVSGPVKAVMMAGVRELGLWRGQR